MLEQLGEFQVGREFQAGMWTAAALVGEDIGEGLGEQSRSVDRLAHSCEDLSLLFLFLLIRGGNGRGEVLNKCKIFSKSNLLQRYEY